MTCYIRTIYFLFDIDMNDSDEDRIMYLRRERTNEYSWFRSTYSPIRRFRQVEVLFNGLPVAKSLIRLKFNEQLEFYLRN